MIIDHYYQSSGYCSTAGSGFVDLFEFGCLFAGFYSLLYVPGLVSQSLEHLGSFLDFFDNRYYSLKSVIIIIRPGLKRGGVHKSTERIDRFIAGVRTYGYRT